MTSDDSRGESAAPPKAGARPRFEFNTPEGAALLAVPLIVVVLFSSRLYPWVRSMIASDLVIGMLGPLLVAVGVTVLLVSHQRGWLRGSLDLPRPPRKTRRIAGSVVGLLVVLGIVLLAACVPVIRSYPDIAGTPDLERGFHLGVIALIVVPIVSMRVVAYRPASRNARLLARDPALVTAISGRRGSDTESVKVVYVPSAMVGPILSVLVDGKRRHDLRPGGALGMYLEAGEHLVILGLHHAGGGEPTRVRLTLGQGSTTTILVSGSHRVPARIESTPGEVVFVLQAPDQSSRFTTHPLAKTWNMGSPRAGVDHVEPGALRDTSPLVTLPDPTAEATPKRPIHHDPLVAASASGAAPTLTPTPTPLPRTGFRAPAEAEGAFVDRHPWWLMGGVALGAAIAGGLLVTLAGSRAPLLPLTEEAWFLITMLGGGSVAHGGVVMERYRRASFAPIRRHPGGLILVALALFTVNSPLLMPTPEVSWLALNSLMVYITGAIAFLWSIGAVRIADSGHGFRRRQRAWAESPRLVVNMAGPADGRATIRVRVNTLEATGMRFGLVGAASYPVSDRGPVGLRGPPGQRRIVVRHASGVVAEFEVTAVAGHVTNVAVGRPAGRLLSIVPRERQLYARIHEPIPGDVEVASG